MDHKTYKKIFLHLNSCHIKRGNEIISVSLDIVLAHFSLLPINDTKSTLIILTNRKNDKKELKGKTNV